jgi:hypothetical protein
MARRSGSTTRQTRGKRSTNSGGGRGKSGAASGTRGKQRKSASRSRAGGRRSGRS